MTRSRSASALALAGSAAVFFFASCGRGGSDVAPTAPVSEKAPVVSDIADPSSFSYSAALGDGALRELVRIQLADPFPRAVLVGASGLDLVPAAGGEAQRISDDPGDSIRFDFDRWGTSLRGDLRYRIADGFELVAEERIAQEEGGEGEEPRFRELWRFRSDAALAAGPLAFDDVVLVATEKPAFLALDRRGGAVVFERGCSVLPRGPLFFLSGSSRLVSFGADGSVVLYAISPEGEAKDAVEAALRPTDAALSLIDPRMRDRLGKRDEKPSFVFRSYPPSEEIPESGVVLFRTEAGETRRSRVYVDGASSKPYLVEIFSASGETLASNLDYVGVEAVLEYGFEEGKTYFVAVALLAQAAGAAQEAEAKPESVSRPRLVIAQK